MKAFTNANPKTVAQALTVIRDATSANRRVAILGGGSDMLGMMKEQLVAPDLVVRLKSIGGLDQVKADKGGGVTIGGQITLDALTRHDVVRERYRVLADAASDVATPQIRNVATLAGNLCQRPWCWYYRNGFHCFKAGGNTCYSANGENEFHAIFGGGPSYIVHPSDTAPALVALDASFTVAGPSGRRVVKAAEFFTLPTVNAARENVLADGEILESVTLPAARAGVRSTYHKVMDREAWTHAVVSAALVLDMNGDTCRSARVVLGGVAPVPWPLPEVDALLAGQRITAAVAAQAGERAVAGARPLAKNGYKVALTRNLVTRALQDLAHG
ncbi:MAG TPA: xanthine dehydrogenase family protein subunit M [Vicinamibacterales bacterium]|nr:xanthine dehydrogenase family protein subunit M [Vicinamibacterales bacterium]